MTTTIQKWGNSLAVRLPKETLRRLRIKEGAKVDVGTDQRRIIIKPTPKQKPTLREIVGAITSENRYEKIDWGNSVGKERW